MAITWDNVVNNLATVIETITPTVSASITFKRIIPGEEMDDLPSSHPYRRFFIETGAASMENDLFTPGSLRLNRNFSVIVSYKANKGPQGNHFALERMMGVDQEQILTKLTLDASRLSGQHWISFEGAEIDRTNPEYILNIISFLTDYDLQR